MNFDEEPDGDPHGECAAEIHRLEDQRDAWKKAAKAAESWNLSVLQSDWERYESLMESARELEAENGIPA